MNKLLIYATALLVVVSGASGANVSAPIPLWPQGAPGESDTIGPELNMTTAKDRPVAGKPVIRLGNVSTPTITIYHPSRFKANGAAVVVCPGGGYHILAMDLEGTEVCHWLNSIGVTGVLLKYRVPARSNDPGHLLPLQDAQRAVALTRSNAKAWRIDPQRVGILGFSAGGHLTAHLLSQFDDADRPDFALLVYPAYLANKAHSGLAPEIKVNKNSPPTFLVQAEDDVLGIDGTLDYYLALQKAKIPSELHLYPSGGHGYGLRPTQDAVTGWPARAAEWLRNLGVLKKNRP